MLHDSATNGNRGQPRCLLLPSLSPVKLHHALSDGLLHQIDYTKLSIDQACNQAKELIKFMDKQGNSLRSIAIMNNKKTACLGENQILKCQNANYKQRLADSEVKEKEIKTELESLRSLNVQLQNKITEHNSSIADLLMQKGELEQIIMGLNPQALPRHESSHNSYPPMHIGSPRSVASSRASSIESGSDPFLQHSAGNTQLVTPSSNGYNGSHGPSASQYVAASALSTLHLMQRA